MGIYDLQIFRGGDRQLVHIFPPIPEPYGSFSKGETIDLRPQSKGMWLIDHVVHLCFGNSAHQTHRTVLLVSQQQQISGDDDAIPWA